MSAKFVVLSIFLIVCISLLRGLNVVKVYFVGAYLNTPVPEDVKHRWLGLDRDASRRLVDRSKDKWSPFLMADGRILVEMQKLLYGYKEAAHYWNEILLQMFVDAGFSVHNYDSCVVFMKRGELDCYIAMHPGRTRYW